MSTYRFALNLSLFVSLIFFTYSTAFSNSYKFDDNDDLTLTLYLPYDETNTHLTTTWETFINDNAELWYDSLEGQSRIKKVTIYNNQPEGLNKADIKILDDSAGDNTFDNWSGWSDGTTVTLSKWYRNNPTRNGAILAHEFGHLIFDLGDEYVGEIDNAPLITLNATQLNDFSNYRSYGWSEHFLMDPDPNHPAINAIDPMITDIMFCVDDHGDTTVMDGNGSEHCTPDSHLGERTVKIKFEEYDYTTLGFIPRTRAADSALTEYTYRTIQEEKHGESAWSTIEDHSSTNFTAPQTVSPNALPSNLLPEIVVIDGFGYAVCLDRSGSMSGTRMDMAKSAAKILINLARGATSSKRGSNLSVTSFSSSARIDAAVREIVDNATRTELKNAVDNLSATGSTAIGEGLRTSYDSLKQMTSEQFKGKAIVLLSDGAQNSGINPLSVLPDLITNDVTVYTIALGTGADKALMEQIARETGGLSFYLPDANNLSLYFLTLFEHVSGLGKIFEKTGIINEGEEMVEELIVNQGSQSVKFSMISDNATTELRLRKPDGTLIHSGSNLPNVAFRSEAGFNMYEVATPLAGTWKAIAYNTPSAGLWEKDEDPDLPIPDLSQSTSEIHISDVGTVNDLKVFIDVNHTYIGDLTIDLVSPTGTTVRLHDQTGSYTDDIIGTYGHDLVAAGDLSAFNGEGLTGTWSLVIYDHWDLDQGTLNYWSIYNTGTSQEAAQVNLRASDQNSTINLSAQLASNDVAFPEAMHLTASVDANGPVSGAKVQATVYSPSGASWTIDLLDSGDPLDGDTRIGDGEYSALFNNYAGNGTYEFEITVNSENGFITREGVPPSSAPVFTRTTSIQGSVSSAPEVRAQIAVKKLQYKLNENKDNKDTFNFQGSFNLDYNVTGSFPGDVTIWMDDWFVTIPQDEWKQKGRFPRFKAKFGGLTVQLDFWKGGSSKCYFNIKGNKQDFSGLLPNYPNIPVGLELGDYFAEFIRVQVDKRGKSYKMGAAPPTPLMFINSINLTVNNRQLDKAKLLLSAKVLGVSSFNPDSDSINLEIGPFQYSIPAGTWRPKNNNSYKLKDKLADGSKVDIKFDAEKGQLNVKVDKASVMFNNPVVLNFQIEGDTEFSWGHLLYLNEKYTSKKTLFRY